MTCTLAAECRNWIKLQSSSSKAMPPVPHTEDETAASRSRLLLASPRAFTLVPFCEIVTSIKPLLCINSYNSEVLFVGSIFSFLLREVFLCNRCINTLIHLPSQNPFSTYIIHKYGPGFESKDIFADLSDGFCLPKKLLPGLLSSHCYSQDWAENLGGTGFEGDRWTHMTNINA